MMTPSNLRHLFLFAVAQLLAFSSMADVKPGDTITIKSLSNGMYVSADFYINENAAPLLANRETAQAWERFTVEASNNSEHVHLIAQSNQRYVSADMGVDEAVVPLTASRTRAQAWERFKIITNADGSVSFQAGTNGKYVSSENTLNNAPLHANRDVIGPWEKFEAQIILSESISNAATLPIEVLGEDGHISSRQFTLDSADNELQLYLVCHRCAYRDSTVNFERGAKASFRINNGSWTSINNETAAFIPTPANDFGGIGGGFRTLEVFFDSADFVQGSNTIEFRFNGTDGFTNGYRIVDMNVVDAAGEKLIAPDTFTREDPNAWSPPFESEANISQGRALWLNATLQSSPIDSSQLKAGCASCHAKNGRDLAYFGFSNKSIEARSRFHGLSEQEGKLIASYIRSLDITTPEKGRPWNPPYQPGANLDSNPEYDWAAGAGWDAVTLDSELANYLYPNGTSQAALNESLKLKGTLNVREMPVPIQMPDWSDWLPEVHPLDYWGDDFANSDGVESFTQAMDDMALNRDAFIANGDVISMIQDILSDTWNEFFAPMKGAQPCINYVKRRKDGSLPYSRMDDVVNINNDGAVTCEDGVMSLNKWLAVKNWEFMHTNELESITPELYPYGEKRGWFGRDRNVFEVAPHRSANNSSFWRHQSEARGAYDSNVWYHLQLILNAGHRDPYTFFPQDWFYTGNWLALSLQRNNASAPNLFVATHLKMLQNLDTTGPDNLGVDKGDEKQGWWVAFTHPWRLESRLYANTGFPLIQLNEQEAGLQAKVAEALLAAWFEKQRTYPIAGLPRQSDPNAQGGDVYEHIDYVVSSEIPESSGCYYSCPSNGYQAQDFYRAMHNFRLMGVDASLRGEIIDWLKQVWPNPANDWDFLRDGVKSNTGASTTLRLQKRNAPSFAIDGQNGAGDGQNAYLWRYGFNNNNQQWTQINRGNGYVSLQKKNTNHCLDGNRGASDGQSVYLWACEADNHNQQWKKTARDSGYYSFQKRNADGFCIDGGSGGEDGQDVKLWTCGSSNHNQHWSLVYSSN